MDKLEPWAALFSTALIDCAALYHNHGHIMRNCDRAYNEMAVPEPLTLLAIVAKATQAQPAIPQ